MDIEVERKFDFNGVPCLLGFSFDECKSTPSVLKASWSLSDEGRVIARGDTNHAQGMLGGTKTMGREMGHFAARKGQHYAIDLDLLEDSSRLNPGNPHLRIMELGGTYPEFESWHASLNLANLFFLPVGGALLLIGLFMKRDKTGISLTEPGPQRGGLHLDSESGSPASGELQTDKKDRWATIPVWLSIGLILLGVASYASIQYWMATRTFVAVDMPVSLGLGHIRTGPFSTNLRDYYSIRIYLDENLGWDAQCLPYSVLQTRWALSRDGKVLATPDEPIIHDTSLEGFDAENGIYDLDVEVLSDASCLNRLHPRLRVSADKDAYASQAAPFLWLSLLCVAVGMSLIFFSITRFSGRSTRAPSFALSEDIRQYFQWAQKLPLQKAFSGPPSFGLVAAIAYFFALASIWVLEAAGQITPVGLSVHLLKPGALSIQSEFGMQPILVQLRYSGYGAPPKLYLNSKLILWSVLDGALNDELKLRPNRVVYVEADSNLEWQEVIKAIDIIRGAQAEVVLLTPDTRRSLHSK